MNELVDLERLREAGRAGLACVSMAEMAALLAVVDAAREATSRDGLYGKYGDVTPLVAALEPFTPPAERKRLDPEWVRAYAATRENDAALTFAERAKLMDAALSDARKHGRDRAWEEVDRWNAKQDALVATRRKRHAGAEPPLVQFDTPQRLYPTVQFDDRWNAEQARAARDLAVKAAVDAAKPNPRDRARDQLADAGVAVQRQFRSDQERIAELEAELEARHTSTGAAAVVSAARDYVRGGRGSYGRLAQAVEALDGSKP